MAANEDDGASRRRIHLREISGDGDNPLETVGQDLRAARIRRGDDLAAVSRALKIRKDHLDALEGDRLDDLPGRTYAIGFVRSYARYLGLDAVEMTERFKAEISGRNDDQMPDASNLHEEEARRLPYGGRVLAGVVILAILYGVWHIFFASRETLPPVPPPLQASSPVAVTSPESGSVPQAAVPAMGPQNLGQQTRDTRVVLRARGATRITVIARDGRILLNRDLAPGDVYPVPSQPGLVMQLSNAGALDVDLDGVSLGRAGGDRQVLGRVSLDPQSLVDRFNSR